MLIKRFRLWNSPRNINLLGRSLRIIDKKKQTKKNKTKKHGTVKVASRHDYLSIHIIYDPMLIKT